MVRRISGCVLAALFAGLFLACSDGDGDEVKKPKEEPLVLVDIDWTFVDTNRAFVSFANGFVSSDNHPYGFDRHPYPHRDLTEGHIVYVSVLNNDFGEVKVRINQGIGISDTPSDYFICKPEHPYNSLSAIFDNSKDEHLYTFTASIDANGGIKKVALCKDTDVGIKKEQELHIIPYNWYEYDFYVYIIGDSNKIDDERHQLLRDTNFWNTFDQVFGQAVAKHGKLYGEFAHYDRGYILVRAHGKYEEDGCTNTKDDIDKAVEYLISNVEKGGQRRNIIPIGYPTKRFWPLRKDERNNIQICGKPDSSSQNPVNFSLELEPLPGTECSSIAKAPVAWDENRGVWYKNNNLEEVVIADYVKHECTVFAETSLGKYAGLGDDLIAVSLDLQKTSIVILPWLEEVTARMAFHELGHLMGLDDLDEIELSAASFIRTKEDNLMHWSDQSNAYKLRKRGIIRYEADTLKKDMRKEYQWDCLHKVDGACIFIGNDPYFR
jgi:hypothetical protein